MMPLIEKKLILINSVNAGSADARVVIITLLAINGLHYLLCELLKFGSASIKAVIDVVPSNTNQSVVNVF